MTRAQVEAMVPVMQAWLEGKVVQSRLIVSMPKAEVGKWNDLTGEEVTFAYNVEWRIKPTPREWWVCPRCSEEWSARGPFTHTCSGGIATKAVRVREVLE